MLFARRCCCRQTGGRVGDTQEGEGVAEIQPRRLSAEDACRDVAEFLPDGPAADDQEAGGGDPQQDVPGAGGGRLGPRPCRGRRPSDRGRSPSGLPWQTSWETRRTPTGLCCRSSPRLPLAAMSRSRVRARWPARRPSVRVSPRPARPPAARVPEPRATPQTLPAPRPVRPESHPACEAGQGARQRLPVCW